MSEVPAHWDVKPLKHWLRERAKALGDKTSPEYEFDYLDISCVGTGFLTAKPDRMKFEDAPSRARQIVQKGDTILSTVRTYLKAVYFIVLPNILRNNTSSNCRNMNKILNRERSMY